MAEKEGIAASMELDREVIRCGVCGLVQYRTRTGNCRRCLRLLPPKVTFVIPTPSPTDLPGDDRQLFENWPNRETVENIGQRIRQLRESRGMTQSQLQARSRVSRSYLSRIESGQMTPSLGTLEKIAEALGVGLNRFFVPETNGETVLEDPFIQGLRPFLRQLDWTQWQGILKRLQAISEHVSTSQQIRPLAPQTAERVPHGIPRRQQHPGGHFRRCAKPLAASRCAGARQSPRPHRPCRARTKVGGARQGRDFFGLRHLLFFAVCSSPRFPGVRLLALNLLSLASFQRPSATTAANCLASGFCRAIDAVGYAVDSLREPGKVSQTQVQRREMISWQGFLGFLTAAGPIFSLFSLLFWLREIGSEVNKTLPEDQRVEWNLTERVPIRIHWLWNEHVRLFPQSRKRKYAALSLVLLFLIPIVAQVARILVTGVQ